VTASTTHVGGVIAANGDAIAADKSNARVVFGLDDAVRPGFNEVRVVIKVTGPETPERYRELQDAVDAHCPVLDLTRNATALTTSVEIG
jgi:hypothetical protein